MSNNNTCNRIHNFVPGIERDSVLVLDTTSINYRTNTTNFVEESSYLEPCVQSTRPNFYAVNSNSDKIVVDDF